MPVTNKNFSLKCSPQKFNPQHRVCTCKRMIVNLCTTIMRRACNWPVPSNNRLCRVSVVSSDSCGFNANVTLQQKWPHTLPLLLCKLPPKHQATTARLAGIEHAALAHQLNQTEKKQLWADADNSKPRFKSNLLVASEIASRFILACIISASTRCIIIPGLKHLMQARCRSLAIKLKYRRRKPFFVEFRCPRFGLKPPTCLFTGMNAPESPQQMNICNNENRMRESHERITDR